MSRKLFEEDKNCVSSHIINVSRNFRVDGNKFRELEVPECNHSTVFFRPFFSLFEIYPILTTLNEILSLGSYLFKFCLVWKISVLKRSVCRFSEHHAKIAEYF